MEKAITVANLNWRYGREVILRDICLDIEHGCFHTVIGPNGSGKTTLFKLISGLLETTRGSVTVEGRDIKDYSNRELSKKIATVPQDTGIDFDFTVEDIVAMGRAPYLRRFQSESEEDLSIVKKSMEMVGICDLKDKSINRVSGGERQRAVIARAIAQDTDIMLLDEPISHIDIRYQIELLDTVKKLNRERGVTVVAILHDLNLASEYSDRITLLDGGEVVSTGSPEEVLTEENIESAYGVKVNLTENYDTGKPHIIPKYDQFR